MILSNFKKIIIILFCILNSCRINTIVSTDIHKNGTYYGRGGTYEVYLKTSENYAYIDLIMSDKHPRFYFSDTIKVDKIADVKWIGKTFMLTKENDYFLIKTICGNDSILLGSSPLKVTLNQEQYSKLNKRKNEAFFYNELTDIKKAYNIDYQNLNKKIEKYKLFEKIETLEFNEFKTEFKKFKNEILQ